MYTALWHVTLFYCGLFGEIHRRNTRDTLAMRWQFGSGGEVGGEARDLAVGLDAGGVVPLQVDREELAGEEALRAVLARVLVVA